MILLLVKTNLSTSCSIDDLPDEVLISILLRLTLVEAVRTLSHRWINLWRFTSGSLVLKLEDRKAGMSFPTEGLQFVNLVNRIMDLHLGPSIDELIIHFGILGHIFPDPLCHCIHFALQKEVKVLELAAFSHPFPDLEKFLTISRVRELKSNFMSLTAFRLVDISIKEEMLEYLLSNCPHLEQLSLKGVMDLCSLNVVSPSLKFLTIWCYDNLQRLAISAVNLVSLEYLGFPTPPSFEFIRCPTMFAVSYMNSRRFRMSNSFIETEFCFENAPNLSEITSDINYFQALVDERHLHEPLKKLTLRFSCQVINMPFYTSPSYHVLPHLRFLKQLELELRVLPGASLLFWVFCAMACPLLSTFYVQFYEATSWQPWDWSTVFMKLPKHRKQVQEQLRCYSHKHLKLVKLMDVVDETNHIEFGVDLLGIAKSLEKLIIKPRSDPHRVAIAEDHAKLLVANLPLGAELVIE